MIRTSEFQIMKNKVIKGEINSRKYGNRKKPKITKIATESCPCTMLPMSRLARD